MILARLRRDAKIGTEKRRAKFGNEFLGCVTGIAPTLAPEFAVETYLAFRPMRLMPISA